MKKNSHLVKRSKIHGFDKGTDAFLGGCLNLLSVGYGSISSIPSPFIGGRDAGICSDCSFSNILKFMNTGLVLGSLLANRHRVCTFPKQASKELAIPNHKPQKLGLERDLVTGDESTPNATVFHNVNTLDVKPV